MTKQQPRRYYAFDSLRAFMMLLGLVLHTALGYTTGSPSDMELPYQDAQTSRFFDGLVSFIHVFRMPTFFVMSGFFAALLYTRRGARPFLRHRIDRLGVPLMVGWPVLALLFVGAQYIAELHTSRFIVPKPVGNFLLHLWFLYDLLIFCFSACLIMELIRRIPKPTRDRVLDLFGFSVNRLPGLVLFAAVSTLPLYFMESSTLDHSGHPLRPLPILFTYAVFFTFGWLLYNRRQAVDRFTTGWLYLVLGTGLYALYHFFIEQTAEVLRSANVTMLREIFTYIPSTAKSVVATFCFSLSVWLMIYGFLGLFLRYLDRESPRWRYLTDASYWMYLIHLPIAVAAPVLFAGLAWPVGIKFALTLSLVAALSLLTYRYGVRATFIGKMLNGRRYSGKVPWRG